jgi:hypothetical protein
MQLDKRNQYLVNLAEDVLVKLEKDGVFAPTQETKNRRARSVHYGILSRQSIEFNEHGDRSDTWCDKCERWLKDTWRGKHRIWLRAIAFWFAVAFFSAAIYFARH